VQSVAYSWQDTFRTPQAHNQQTYITVKAEYPKYLEILKVESFMSLVEMPVQEATVQQLDT
jgi:hypothetical protein